MTVQYFVGDLCYVMHDEWSEVCGIISFDNTNEEYELEDGRKFFLFTTAYGDGSYNDLEGNPYSVDSGTIGAIKVEDIRDPYLEKAIEYGLGHIHEFPEELTEADCGYEDGLIILGPVEIDTDPVYDDEFEQLEEDGEEDA